MLNVTKSRYFIIHSVWACCSSNTTIDMIWRMGMYIPHGLHYMLWSSPGPGLDLNYISQGRWGTPPLLCVRVEGNCSLYTGYFIYLVPPQPPLGVCGLDSVCHQLSKNTWFDSGPVMILADLNLSCGWAVIKGILRDQRKWDDVGKISGVGLTQPHTFLLWHKGY